MQNEEIGLKSHEVLETTIWPFNLIFSFCIFHFAIYFATKIRSPGSMMFITNPESSLG